MSAATAAAAYTVPRTQPVRLLRLKRIGYAVLGVQLLAFMVWSTILYRRFSLTYDFGMYHQGWYLIAHGNLDPYNTLQRLPFWQDHCEFLMWPLALLYWLWPHGVTLLWVQDACVVGVEAVAFTWMCELAGRQRQERDSQWLASVGLVLLVANPWTWWTITQDFHMEPLEVLFAALLAWDLANGRRRAWVWVTPLLACGDVASTYLIGVGLAGVLAGRGFRMRGAVLGLLGVTAILIITLVHGNRSSGGGLHAYAYLATAGPTGSSLSLFAMAKGIVTHPLRILQALWAKRIDIWANLAPSGLLGVAYVWLLPLSMIVLLADYLWPSWLFASPGFQNVPLYPLLAVGTVAVLGWLAVRRRRTAFLLAGLLAVQAIGWAVVWGSRTPGQWLRVSSASAATLASVAARIPATAEVIASQGVVGRLSGRSDVHPIFGPGTVSVGRGETWFIIAPLEGIETQSTASATALIGELADMLHATLVKHANGVWAFRWRPPPDVHSIRVPGNSAALLAWAAPLAPGAVARRVMTGPAGNWRVTSTGRRGYVADGLAWQERPGRYQALVSLSASGPVNVEVWNDTGRVLLSRRSVPATTGVESVVLPVDATTAYRANIYSGWGPFRAHLNPPRPGQRLEVRVWSAGTGTVNVYGAHLTPAGGGTGHPEDVDRTGRIH